MPEQPIKLFISHASEDKEAFVKGLAAALNANPKFEVWYDDYSLHLGDSLLESIAKGMHSCQFAIVVVSPAFISKRWTSNELNGLFALETSEHKMILPIWHNVTLEQVLAFNPILADRKAIPSAKSTEEIVFAIEFATGISQRTRELESPYEPLIAEIKNEILERNVNAQFGNSSEGNNLVLESITFIFDQLEQTIAEQLHSLEVKIQRQDSPTHTRPYPSLTATGPSNANLEVFYMTKMGRKLLIVLFSWDDNFPGIYSKRRERNYMIYNPSFTADSEVIWTLEGDVAKARRTSFQIAHTAVSSLLHFIRERVQRLDNFPGAYHPPSGQ
jgi:hypothetical protein